MEGVGGPKLETPGHTWSTCEVEFPTQANQKLLA